MTKKSRHIDIKYKSLKKLVAAKTFKIEWVPTLLQRADVITKGAFRSVIAWAKATRFLLTGRMPPEALRVSKGPSLS